MKMSVDIGSIAKYCQSWLIWNVGIVTKSYAGDIDGYRILYDKR